MNLGYFKEIYKAIRDKLVLPMERKNIEKSVDYNVYQLLGNEWVSLSGVEGIADRH